MELPKLSKEALIQLAEEEGSGMVSAGPRTRSSRIEYRPRLGAMPGNNSNDKVVRTVRGRKSKAAYANENR